MTAPVDGPGVRLGVITLCQVCHRAVQLRREHVRSSYDRGRPYVDIDLWAHMHTGGIWHDIELPEFFVR